jgi:hypothetical protein
MSQKRKNRGRSTRTTLRLPDLDQSKNSVLQSLGSAASKRTYGAASKISSVGIALNPVLPSAAPWS